MSLTIDNICTAESEASLNIIIFTIFLFGFLYKFFSESTSVKPFIPKSEDILMNDYENEG